MKAYLRFPVPHHIGAEIQRHAKRHAASIKLSELKPVESLHVTLANFAEIENASVALVNKRIEQAFLHQPIVAPTLHIRDFAAFEVPHNGKRLLVALASAEPLVLWRRFRQNLLNALSLDAPFADHRLWNPHITLAGLGEKSEIEAELPDLSWQPDAVELVWKAEYRIHIIQPVYKF